MKIQLNPPALLAVLAASLTAVIVDAQIPACPEGSPNAVSTFSLPSGDACNLCLPELKSCGITCACPTLQCDTYSCDLSPPGCGTAVCAGGGQQIFPTESPTPAPTTAPVTAAPVVPTVPPPTFQAIGTGIVNPFYIEPPKEDCASYITCKGCLKDANCGFWYNGPGCYNTTAVADAAFYNLAMNPDQTVDSLCTVAANEVADARNCGSQRDCRTCMATPLAGAGGGTCAWFPAAGYCAPPGCSEMGCGETDPSICPLPDCSELNKCDDCLAAPNCDAWSDGQCFPTCMEAPQDIACYSQEYINGLPKDICKQAKDDADNDNLCAKEKDCASCTNTFLKDKVSTCQWFSDGGFCAAGCGMTGCGDTHCCGDNPCVDPSGACRLPGDDWFSEDDSWCQCEEVNGEVVLGCVGKPVTVEPTPNLSIDQAGTNCNGVTVDLTCTIMDDANQTACHEYVPSDSEGCEVEVKYSYMASQVAPPLNAILTSVVRSREDSYHGSERKFVENRWGENLTPTMMATYGMKSWEGEFVNFCLRDVKPPTVFDFWTDLCKTTATYELTQSDTILDQLPEAPATVAGAEPKVPGSGETTETFDSGIDGSTSAAQAGASTIHFMTVLAIGGIFLVM